MYNSSKHPSILNSTSDLPLKIFIVYWRHWLSESEPAPVCHIHRSSTILSSNDKTAFRCVMERHPHRWRRLFLSFGIAWTDCASPVDDFCSQQSVTLTVSSIKNSDRLIPNAVQIFSNEATEGCSSFRYQVEIVDWVTPAFRAMVYTVHLRLILSDLMRPRISKFAFSRCIIYTIPFYICCIYLPRQGVQWNCMRIIRSKSFRKAR